MVKVTYEEWRELCEQKIAAAKRLIKKNEWVAASENMGYGLECALKAATCVTLHKPSYPPLRITKDGDKAGNHTKAFMTHEFDYLLIYSGLTDLLADDFSWNEFNKLYTGAWNERRYDVEIAKVFTKPVVINLSKFLYDGEDSILEKIKKEQKW